MSLSIPQNLDTMQTIDTIASKIKSYDAGIDIKISSVNKLQWDRAKSILTDELNTEILLADTERIIVSNLARKINEFVSYDEILQALKYANLESSEKTLRVQIHRLRKKLGFYQDFLVTRRNVGISLRDGDGRMVIR